MGYTIPQTRHHISHLILNKCWYRVGPHIVLNTSTIEICILVNLLLRMPSVAP